MHMHCSHRSLDNEVVHSLWRIVIPTPFFHFAGGLLLGLAALPRAVACVLYNNTRILEEDDDEEEEEDECVCGVGYSACSRREKSTCLHSFICAMLVDDKTERSVRGWNYKYSLCMFHS
jgi:hypothetical protein